MRKDEKQWWKPELFSLEIFFEIWVLGPEDPPLYFKREAREKMRKNVKKWEKMRKQETNIEKMRRNEKKYRKKCEKTRKNEKK